MLFDDDADTGVLVATLAGDCHGLPVAVACRDAVDNGPAAGVCGCRFIVVCVTALPLQLGFTQGRRGDTTSPYSLPQSKGD